MKLVNEKQVIDTIDLLGWKDISTKRQQKNGTIIYRLPIKMYGQYIEVGSFQSGYVRRMNGGYTPYQLNKCEPNVEYYPEYKWVYDESGEPDHQIKTGKYNRYVGKSRILIPIEIDRLEYLISYCLKNYFIKRANEVADGKLIPKWTHEWELERANETYSENTGAMARISELEDRIYELESQVEVADNKLSNAISPTKYESVKRKLAETKVRQDVSVIVNGHRYKVI